MDADSASRSQQPWWCAIATIARRIGMDGQDAVALADDLTKAGYVTHDQSQHTKEARRTLEQPHSVTLREAGRQLAKGK
ncbi:hypothetical protein [Reyranella sp.]|uniref:hypothetical protein n=1 Tax=Reyranella sp. TaxID=1929291 RepID=UPI003D110193